MSNTREQAVLTVAAVRTSDKSAPSVLFNERQRIFTLSKRLEGDAPSIGLLRSAAKDGRPLSIVLDAKSAVQSVAAPSSKEIEDFARSRVLLERPSKPVRIEADALDPTTFNFADLHLKWPAFRLCTKIVPSYTKAKEIFDFCAELSCHLPGPFTVTPCIPFQYVRDGCYARAHQMRRIITTRYRYCCEKVFSFANQGNDRLALKAGKWGGCCVTWWYHVAPLVRVRFRIKGYPQIQLALAMVIDPGMFDKPVLLSTWLQAQQDTACSPDAHLSMYSIQPGSAYTPANYAGTAFNTDPGYVSTQNTLINYSGLKTCP